MGKKKHLKRLLFDLDQDDTFAFIAGHTSGGAPFGVPWEGPKRVEGASPPVRRVSEEDEEILF